MKMQQKCLKTLQQGIVQFAGNPFSLFKTSFQALSHLRGHLPQPQAIHEQRRQSGANYTAQLKPPGLPNGGLNFEPDRSLRTVPQTIAVTGHDTESVPPCAQIVISGFPARPPFTPCMVKTVQTVTIAHSLRIAEAQSHVAKCRPPRARWKVNGASEVQRCAVAYNALNVHQSRSRSSCCPCRSHHRETTVGGKPNTSPRIRDNRLVPLYAFST